MPKKIFIGNQNISSQIADYKRGFNNNGVKTMTVVSAIYSQLIRDEMDYNISKMRDYKFAWVRPSRFRTWLQEYFKPKNRIWRKAIRECDTFMFIWESFAADYSDYKILKEKNKKIITVFTGDDIRWYNAMKQHFSEENMTPIEYYTYDFSIANLESKLKYLRTAEKYSDLIISVPDQSQLSLRPYKFYSTILNIDDIIENSDQAQRPLIIHAPSDKKIKGTKYVLQAIEELEKVGMQFDFKLIEEMPRAEILKWYKKADIVIGQLGVGLGKQGMEVLGSGTILLTGLNRMCAVNDEYFEENPAINITRDNIAEILKSLIPDIEYRRVLAKKGRPFIEKYHSPEIFCRGILEIMEKPETKRKYDVYPDFFRKKFIPESEESLAMYNKWTRTVMDCNWYKENVPAGERAGLLF